MDFLKIQTEAFGLDISDLSLKIAKLKRKKGLLTLSYFNQIPLTQGIIEKGEIQKPEALAEILKDILRKDKKKIGTRNVVASLPEEKAFLQVIKLPKMSAQEAQKAVVFEAENYIPYALDQVFLGSQIVEPLIPQEQEINVLIAALPKTTVLSYVTVLKKAGLLPCALEIESLAIARAVIKEEKTPRPVLIVDFGATRTGFIIFFGNAVRFTSSIPISSHLLTKRLAQGLKININQAEELKRRIDLDRLCRQKGNIIFHKESFSRKKIQESILPPLIDLAEQIASCADFYLTHDTQEKLEPQQKGIEKILMTGGGSKFQGLCSFLNSRLKIPVELANPWINILPAPLQGPAGFSLKDSLEYTTALGLALLGAHFYD